MATCVGCGADVASGANRIAIVSNVGAEIEFEQCDACAGTLKGVTNAGQRVQNFELTGDAEFVEVQKDRKDRSRF